MHEGLAGTQRNLLGPRPQDSEEDSVFEMGRGGGGGNKVKYSGKTHMIRSELKKKHLKCYPYWDMNLGFETAPSEVKGYKSIGSGSRTNDYHAVAILVFPTHIYENQSEANIENSPVPLML